MKTKIMGLVSIMLLGTMSLFAQDKTEKVKVYGNCDMCKTRIEKAANGVEGVKIAEWDKESNMLEVTFKSPDADVVKVHMAVAKVGHDTDKNRAKDEVYANLPGCCKYTRPEVKPSKLNNK